VRRSLPVIAALVAVLLLAACTDDAQQAEPSDPFTNSPTEATPTFSGGGTPSSAAVSPTPPAIPDPPPKTKGPANATCVQGWVTPQAGTPMFTDPLGVIRRTAPVAGDFEVVDMRMFVGPESPPSVGDEAKGYLQDIRRWYIKLFVPSDLRYQGRFIVEQRVFGRGVAAVAPYDTEGFSSPDWSGFQYDSAKRMPKLYPGLPGAWSGVRYDFVRGGAGLSIPGLPDEVTGCLDGT
jgi:hypothetical protein